MTCFLVICNVAMINFQKAVTPWTEIISTQKINLPSKVFIFKVSSYNSENYLSESLKNNEESSLD